MFSNFEAMIAWRYLRARREEGGVSVMTWISLIGIDASSATRLFFGWFGPRGLATALFALIVVKEISAEFGEPILNLAVNAVWISALLHGVTALPGAKLYANRQENSKIRH